MITATIYVDDRPFSGIDYEAEDNTQPPPAFRPGFHNYNWGGGRDVLKFGGEPYKIESRRNLQSYLDRIMSRIDDGTIKGKVVRIELGDEG